MWQFNQEERSSLRQGHPDRQKSPGTVELINNYVVAVHLPFPAKDPEASPGPRVMWVVDHNLGGLIWSIVS
jgi:hypothetical protein